MSDELKPCPFCGREAEKHTGSFKDGCMCTNDKCVLFARIFLIKAWNTRTNPMLEKLIDHFSANDCPSEYGFIDAFEFEDGCEQDGNCEQCWKQALGMGK